ncbi:CASP-like protein 4B1 [Nymphaea colorata]|uniref:CASP-like protein 4B1 n=1 Tax=Nymphaea colorata TaxID=210225 RepID=UPI00129D56E4|nr:CASP-like protein 4B1 [Nymphaea colorata]
MEKAEGSMPVPFPPQRQPPWQSSETVSPQPQATGWTAAPVPDKRADTIVMVSLVLTVLALIFSFLSMVIMASNNNYVEARFTDFEELKYLISIATIACFYAFLQLALLVFQLASKSKPEHRRHIMYLAFLGSQILAYLLISAASAALPNTKALFDYYNALPIKIGSEVLKEFLDKSAASISMAVFAFIFFAISAVLSACKAFKTCT